MKCQIVNILANYNVYKTSKKGGRGGVLLAVRTSFDSNQLPPISPISTVDLIGITLKLNEQIKLNIINLYLPPASPVEH